MRVLDSHRSAGSTAHSAHLLEERIGALETLTIGTLKAAWSEAWGAPPPKGARRRLLMLGLAWKWQEEVHGGFSRPLERRLAALDGAYERQDFSNALESGVPKPPPRLLPGNRLIRTWRGARHEVHVTEHGYLWRGETHRSLSAIARAITGVRRNGPAFFGLREKETS